MNKPKYWDEMQEYRHFEINYWAGSYVKSMFYHNKKWYDHCIPEVLEKRGWEPDDKKIYKCWWYSTNPSDPADPGEDILVYIEEMSDTKVNNTARNLTSKITKRLYAMSIDDLRQLDEYIERRY